MKEHVEMFEQLMDAGLVYRYSKQRWEDLLELGGKEFESPYRVVPTPKGEMIEELIQPTLQPLILSGQEWQFLEKLAVLWEKFLAAQREIFLSDSEVAEVVATSREREMSKVKSGYEAFSPFIRLDCVRGDNGEFRVVDINSTRPAGVGDVIVLQDAMDGFTSSKMKTAFVNTVQKCFQEWIGQNQLSNIGMLTEVAAGDWHNMRILSEVLSDESWVEKAEVVTEISQDNHPECLVRSRVKEGHPMFGQLETAYQNGTCVISPLYRRWVGNKQWMNLVSTKKYADIFSAYLDSDYELFADKLFPQTGIYEDGYVRFPGESPVSPSELNRKEWIVKDPSGSSAVGMIIGRRVSQKKWNMLMGDLANGAVFQKFYRSRTKEPVVILNKDGEPEERQLYIKYGVFIFNGTLAGVEVFARRDALVHGSRDAYFTFAYPKR